MNNEKFQALYKNTKKEEIIEELYYKCKANNELVSEIERLKISLSAQEELTMNEYHKKKQLENIIKEVREKINSFDVFKEFTFPLMKREEENQVKSSIDYEWRKSIKEPLLKILDKVGVDKK